jgi:hypothetical protein
MFEIGYVDMNWINPAQVTEQMKYILNIVMNFQVPYNFGPFFSIWEENMSLKSP